MDVSEISREQAPCSYANQNSDVFVVPDLAADPCFEGSPLLTAGIRFHAGAPLFTRAGFGTICVLDDTPRQIDEAGRRVLQDVAGMVTSQVERQNMIGRVDATTGLPSRYQTFEDLEDLEGLVLVRALITMAHDLGYRVMAEGIEMQDAFDMLRSWGCDEGQDSLLSRSVAPSVTGAWRGRYVAA